MKKLFMIAVMALLGGMMTACSSDLHFGDTCLLLEACAQNGK